MTWKFCGSMNYLDAPSLEGLTRHLSGGKVQPGLFIVFRSFFFRIVFFFDL